MIDRKKLEYAIVDIETTGGFAGGSRMTEIAIVIHDGEKVVDRWESLINPQQHIPLAIFALTGITNEMVADAPLFQDIAQQVFSMLDGRVFVAHNVNFDYSFVRHELEDAGISWSARKLCTVRLARKIFPGFASYSLGRLCDRLAIPVSSRHRAGGDADATAILFSRLMQNDDAAQITEMLKKASADQRLPPNLKKEDFDNLPSTPGVYYFLNQFGKVIYVGKAINLKKRVGSHFTGNNVNPQRQHFLREIFHISYEVCATELMALLLECAEIKRLWPAYNRALKRFEPKFGLFCYQGLNGYDYLAVGKLSKQQSCLHIFNREYDGINMLRKLMDTHSIDYRFCKFGPSQSQNPKLQTETGGNDLPDRLEHNELVAKAIAELSDQQPSFALIDKGRATAEKSCIWIEKGTFYGMGYIDETCQLSSIDDVKHNLDRYPGNHYMVQLIYDYADKNPTKVHWFSYDYDSEPTVGITAERSPYKSRGLLF